MPKRDGGTWQKTEVKTDQTGEQILEIGRGIEKNVKDNLKKGDSIVGYIEKRPWTGRDGQTRYNMVLNGITAEYVYDLLLRVNPDVESLPAAEEESVEEGGSSDGFDNSSGGGESNNNDW